MNNFQSTSHIALLLSSLVSEFSQRFQILENKLFIYLFFFFWGGGGVGGGEEGRRGNRGWGQGRQKEIKSQTRTILETINTLYSI